MRGIWDSHFRSELTEKRVKLIACCASPKYHPSTDLNSSATLASMSVLTQGVGGLGFSNAGSGTCSIGTSYTAGSVAPPALVCPIFCTSRC